MHSVPVSSKILPIWEQWKILWINLHRLCARLNWNWIETAPRCTMEWQAVRSKMARKLNVLYNFYQPHSIFKSILIKYQKLCFHSLVMSKYMLLNWQHNTVFLLFLWIDQFDQWIRVNITYAKYKVCYFNLNVILTIKKLLT